MAGPSTPNMPSVSDAGAVINASNSDWRAMLIAIMFLFVALAMFVIWREILSWRLAKSLDGVKEALIALRIEIAETAAEVRATQRFQQNHRSEDVPK